MATTKQKIAVKKISENVGNTKPKSMGKILRESGYSESVSKSPRRVTESKGWKELLEDYFPSEELLKVHKRLLNKKEIVTYQGNYIKTKQPHSDVKYALDMIYKLKGFYKEDEIINEDQHHNLSDKELNAEIDRLERELGIKKRV
ncbi:MAG: hypothetical protein UR96_C0002G0023 [candidate division WS6 bacterium GW2011_GWC1_36_11]|uniref:Uncharacterized protein n=1 Tax=candidate division WS6 bacterium GW2011_GWC1_36_11 TaxID=1619090 RepID=A0A0G0DFD2_9BACT|nr:MAG: hypothetical protein UR96_C0002G0023 [candidate division WS6 bacterium GW2011_GWC1_36_11]KKQ04653.1 MAG: hypothetical protein US14_C0003G0016 [candidate division WS6 bacterium GW2011_WS6_36_26]